MVLPPHDLPKEMIDEVRQASHDLAKAIGVIGLMNIQFAIKDGELFLIEVARGLHEPCPSARRRRLWPSRCG